MHELAITESLIETVCEAAAGRRVSVVRVEAGALTGVFPDAMEFCFELATEGTVAAGARLELTVIPGIGSCRSCGNDIQFEDFILLCPCGSADVVVRSGRDIRILSIDVEDREQQCAQPADAASPTAR
ncbi:MAG: hydrogenase maturation nickel metallochaperone HypA [Nocardiaceae bacterium]|nr:hydrogenase maturation nickel metallochaperone HypA [Nocardiaceae bacterium]